MNKKELDGVIELTFDEKCMELANIRDRIEALKKAEWLVGRSLIEDMEERGSEEARFVGGLVNIRRDVRRYDPNVLAGLREITDPVDLDGVYSPEREEVQTVTVKEKWNMKAGMKLGRRSAEHAEIIEAAKIYKFEKHDPRRVKINIEEGGDN